MLTHFLVQGSDEALVKKLNKRISLVTGLDTTGTFTFKDDDDWIQVFLRGP